MTVEKGWLSIFRVGWQKPKCCTILQRNLEKNPNQRNFSYQKSHSHWLGIEQFPDIYNRSWSRNRYITTLFLILLIHNHLAVITKTTTASIFRSANTNLRMWSCTAATVRCCHCKESNTTTQQQSVISHIIDFRPQLVTKWQIQQQLK